MTIDVELPFPTTHARRRDPQTSKDAAARVTTAASHRAMLLRAYYIADTRGLTAEEAGDVTGLGHVPAQRRISDLIRNGHLYYAGAHRLSTSGREMRVLRITDAGVALVEATS